MKEFPVQLYPVEATGGTSYTVELQKEPLGILEELIDWSLFKRLSAILEETSCRIAKKSFSTHCER